MTNQEARRLIASAGYDSDDEWLLMYLSGLTGRQIATLCRVHPNAVHNRLRRFTAAVPAVRAIHESLAPAERDGTCRPVSAYWIRQLEDVIAYRSETGHLPYSSLAVAEHARLGRWLDAQRRKLRQGNLHSEKIALLDLVKGWRTGHRKKTERERWAYRIRQLTEFRRATGRLPSYRSTDHHERVIGVWLHGRRTHANNGTLEFAELAELSMAVPDWRGRTRAPDRTGTEYPA